MCHLLSISLPLSASNSLARSRQDAHAANAQNPNTFHRAIRDFPEFPAQLVQSFPALEL